MAEACVDGRWHFIYGLSSHATLLCLLVKPLPVLAAAGAAAFVFSDTLIGINRFGVAFDAAPFLLITTYWLGQRGISASAFHQTTRAHEGQVG